MGGCLLGPPRFTAVPTTPAGSLFPLRRRANSTRGSRRYGTLISDGFPSPTLSTTKCKIY